MHKESGQIGLVVLLVMATMVTVGVGAISRSTQDLKITRQEYESTVAFNAAEAGLEKALSQIESNSIPESSGGQVTNFDGIAVDYSINPVRDLDLDGVPENQVIEVDTSTAFEGSADGERTLVIGWNTANAACDTHAKLVVKAYDTSRNIVQNFYISPSVCTDATNDLQGFQRDNDNKINVVIEPSISLVRIKPVGNSAAITVNGQGWQLPVQGYKVNSKAIQEEGKEAKVLVLDRTREQTPTILDYALFSGTTILMN